MLFKRINCYVLITLLFFALLPVKANAADITGYCIISTDGVEYEYVIDSWKIVGEPPEGQHLVNPIPGDSITIGQEKEISINKSYSISTEVTQEASTKFAENISANVSLFKVVGFSTSMEKEFNYKISGTKKETYTESVSLKQKLNFDSSKAAEGYNTCAIYSGILYNKCEVTLKKYKVHKYSHRHWFLGSKHTHKERGEYIGKVTLEAEQPIVVILAKYYKASTLKSAGGVTFNKQDTVILKKSTDPVKPETTIRPRSTLSTYPTTPRSTPSTYPTTPRQMTQEEEDILKRITQESTIHLSDREYEVLQMYMAGLIIPKDEFKAR